MKDYSKEIMSVLVSSLISDSTLSSENNTFVGKSGLSKAVIELNHMIQNEVLRLESELVSLTELLMESDSLLMEVRRKSTRPFSENYRRTARV